MKKTILFVFLVCTINAFSQETISLKAPKSTIKTDREPQLFYASLGGPALALSLNYDRRFSKQVDGLGFNVGFGFTPGEYANGFTSIPFGINYLMGNAKKGRYLELGVSQTVLFLPSSNTSTLSLANKQIYPNSTISFTNFIIGYRSQPSEGGFNFRGGINPIIFKGETGLVAYLSFGYNF